ncbi:extracellular solute-binding protein [Sansalvadorimonas sp. 2012CJ34-2]|uniref:Extracellular solute-binding protein n=1 Tax=Parendozoicomonas callyspongiae TaxID=2942213 RepID=A0ABT0PHC9_9GAMM|nr:extracellular solute-binding protein [Sansalvadorimonas sp. 2012CJ34-2]MCL6270783.1 extracellular solute-binding protein [Sansalvadorimonas sp. 2012CJ34-2]
MELSSGEEGARGIFQSGNAVFMRNWPYAWALAEGKDSPVQGNVSVTVMPRGGGHGTSAPTLGGWQLGVSKYSHSKQAAAELVMWLTSEQEQKRRAIEGSLPPTIVSLYDDPDILRANPFIGQLKSSFDDAIARPSTVAGENYNKVSSAVFNSVHNILSGGLSPEESLIKLEKKLKGIKLKDTN